MWAAKTNGTAVPSTDGRTALDRCRESEGDPVTPCKAVNAGDAPSGAVGSQCTVFDMIW
jgi:hypothetical protein